MRSITIIISITFLIFSCKKEKVHKVRYELTSAKNDSYIFYFINGVQFNKTLNNSLVFDTTFFQDEDNVSLARIRSKYGSYYDLNAKLYIDDVLIQNNSSDTIFYSDTSRNHTSAGVNLSN